MKKKILFALTSTLMMALASCACAKQPTESSASVEEHQSASIIEPPASSSVASNPTSEPTSIAQSSSDQHVHVFGAWTTTKTATHTEEGEEKRTCECGEIETRAIPKTTEHIWSSWSVVTKPTCEEEGLQERTCPCGERETEKIDPTGHSYGAWVTTKESTCSEMGTKTRTCLNCHHSYSENIPTVSHSYNYSEYGCNDKTHYRECIYGCGTTNYSQVHNFAYDSDSTVHWKHCTVEGCPYESEKESHFWVDKAMDTTLASPASPTSPATYYRSCACGRTSTETFENGYALAPNGMSVKVNPTFTSNGVATLTYASGETSDVVIPQLTEATSDLWRVSKTGNCKEGNYITYYAKNLSSADAMAKAESFAVSNPGASKHQLYQLFTKWGAYIQVSNKVSDGHVMVYIEPTRPCTDTIGSSGYYQCTICKEKFSTPEGDDFLMLNPNRLSAIVSKSVYNQTTGKAILTAKLYLGTIRNGDKVEMITETGRVVTGPVSSLATTKDGVSSRVDYVTSTGNPEFTFELPVNFAGTNLNLKLLTARTHTYGEDGVCTECGYHEDIKSNCYVLTGTAKTGGVSIPVKSTINLSDSSSSKTYTAYVASVNDQTSGTVTVAEGEQLSVVVSISGAYNLTSSDYLYLTNQKLWVSRFYNDMDATIVPSQTKTFFLDGITAHAVDNNTGKYYRDDFMGEEVSRSTVISTAPEKNATAWFEITGTPTIGTAGASVSVTLNKGDISIGDSFNVYSSEGKLLNGLLVSCKVAAIQVGSKTTTTLANGQTGILVLKAVNAAAQSPRDQDVTSTYIKKGIYCAF